MLHAKVLISGAGIAGPALAHWLTRYGADVTVVETAPSLRTGGQLIDIRGTGRGVLDRAGLAETVRAARTAADGLSLVDTYGRRQATMRTESFGGDGPVGEIEILRGALSRIFYDASCDTAEYLFGDRITALDERQDGVHVTFDTGPARVFDAVIGADGLHSNLRDLLFGPKSTRLRHLGHYLSFWTVENTAGLNNWTELYSEPGRTLATRAIRDNTAAMAVLAFRSAEFDYDYRDLDALAAVVRSHAAGMGWQAKTLISQIDQAPDFYFDSCSQVILPRWSSGRVGLLGDAAFCASPLSGHGTTIALVGAYVLAGELARADGDTAAGMRAYEQKLRPWINRVQRFGQGNGRTMTPKTALGIEFRRRAVQLQEHLPNTALLMRDQVRMSNGFTLPDYTRFEVSRQH
ncbi:FAD-dependent monooxygenase [Nocardia sp. NPDC060256]|uniref:FAD-dependent monooxygenase n=1 Tax=unclassified Nocardia TaxID=2637762 RepID=UPI0036551E99